MRGGYRGDNRGGRGGFNDRGTTSGGGSSNYSTNCSSGARESHGRGGGRGGGGRGGRGRGGGGAAPISCYFPGQKFQVLTNHFQIRSTKDSLDVHKYLVEIENSTLSYAPPKNEENEKILEKFFTENSLGNMIYAYDRDRSLYTRTRLNLQSKIIDFKGRQFNVTVTHQATFDLMKTHSDVRATDESCPMLDVIFQAATQQINERQGRTRYVPRSPTQDQLINLNGFPGRKIWMGHSQSIQSNKVVRIEVPNDNSSPRWGGICNPYQTGDEIFITALISPAAVISVERQLVSDYLRSAYQYAILGNSGSVPKIAKCLKGFQLETNYMPSRTGGGTEKRTFKFECIDFSKTARTHEFEHNGCMTTLYKYFQSRYGIRLEFPDAPLIQVKPVSRNTYLPAELVYLSLQKCPGVYSEKIKSALADSMCFDPMDRRKYIEEKINKTFPDNEVLREFGISVDTQMSRWNAELLEPPQLEYNVLGQGRTTTFTPERGTWNMRDKGFLNGQILNRVRVIDITGGLVQRGQRSQSLDNFIEELRRQVKTVGMEGSLMVKAHDVQLHRLSEFKKQVLEKEPADMIFVLIPAKETSVYKVVKSTLDDLCPSQCLVVANTPGLGKDIKGKGGHFCNILAKVNQKLVGRNHRISQTWSNSTLKTLCISPQRQNGFMVIGVNMSNPQSTNMGVGKLLPSVCSLVSSADIDCTRWVHSFRIQRRGNELIEDLQTMLIDTLRKRNNLPNGISEWPDRIIFIRDGTSEGKMADVCMKEIQSIREAYSREGKQPPRITAFAAIRNHQTRFWDSNPQDARANLGPGTFISTSGVHLGKYPNFYLLSHAGIKGTSRPIRYFILMDEVGMMDEIKSKSSNDLIKFWASFLYQQAYLYQRCQRAVRVPCAIYYADLLAQRGRIIASPLIEKFLGINLIDTDDTISVSSGNLSRPGNIMEEDYVKTLDNVNNALRKFTESTNLMFYC